MSCGKVDRNIPSLKGKQKNRKEKSWRQPYSLFNNMPPKTISPFRQRALFLYPSELEPGRGSNTSSGSLTCKKLLCFSVKKPAQATSHWPSLRLRWFILSIIKHTAALVTLTLGWLTWPESETHGLLKYVFSGGPTWSSAVHQPAMSKRGH